MQRSSSLEKATQAWGADMPQAVRDLAIECDQSSQNAVAKRIGRSGAAVSQVLSNQYKGDLHAVLTDVKSLLTGQQWDCCLPYRNIIPALECRRISRCKLSTTSPLSVRNFRACKQCPNNPNRGG